MNPYITALRKLKLNF